MSEEQLVQVHRMKSLPEQFIALAQNRKQFDLRKEDDRTFAVHDIAMFEEWDPMTETYTGRHRLTRITHIIRHGEVPFGDLLAPLVACLSVRLFKEPRSGS
jgi:hypothetical protein